MTFSRSLFISSGLHILLFGSALAFAQYGHVLGRFDAITVTLVEANQSSGKSSRKTEHSPRMASGAPQAPPRDAAVPGASDSGEMRRVPEAAKEPAGDQHFAGAVDGNAEKGPVKEAAREERGSRFGVVTPDQWQAIQAALERAKTYPRMARERGIEGVAHVRFKVLPSGNVERVEVVKSSGSEILDDASIKTVYRSVPLPQVSGWIEVPISYSIIR